MKFKRIDVDTVRCLISEEELFENGLEVDDFLQNSEKTEDFLRKILARAAEEVGYRIQGGNISIQVAVLPDHVLALTFSEKPDHGIMNMLDHLKHAVDAISQNVQERKEASEDVVPERNVQEERAMKMVGRPEYQLSFDSLEQVIQYCRNVLLELPVDSDLYKLEERNIYFLFIRKDQMTDKQICRLLGAALEFATGVYADRGLEAYVKEHGELLIGKNAMFQLQNV